MFNTTLRYLNLIILPHPSFDIPLSEADPEFQKHGRKGDIIDTSYISQNQISQFGPIEFSTPRKQALKANFSHERRRNTICCYSSHHADSFPANEDGPTWPVNMSFNSFLSSDTSRYPFYEDVPVPPTSTGVKIVTPHDSPSPSSSWVKQPRVTSFVDFSDLKNVRNIRENASKGKEKRNSAPAAVSLGKERFNEVIDITSAKDTTQSHPTLLCKDQHPKPHASISPYTSKHFEIGLSPILEDTHTFANTLRGPKSVEKKPATSDMVDSSESSYGELIQKKTISYLSTSEYEYETFGGLEWENQERKKQSLSLARFSTQDCAGNQYGSDQFWEKYFEDSSLVPELTLTAPTPELATSAKFRSEAWPCESGLDYQLPEANANRPSRLGYSTTLASISKALGTGADMLLGVGDGVFDDMLDTGINSCGTSQPHASAAGHDHLGDDWLSSLTAQPLGKSQAETGFLGQLLRRKDTGSQISERKDRVWQRVSRIFHSSRRSSRSAHDQVKNTGTASAPLAINKPWNANRGWKRFSHILSNVTVSSRRRSAGDQVQFTVDPACSGLSDFGSTRRHGLDIPSESADQVGERWVGSMDRMARPERNFFGVKFFDHHHEPRRQSFGFDLGMRLSKRRWRSSADYPTEDERIRNRYERHSVVY